LHLIFNQGNRKVDDDSHVVFGQTFPGEKESVEFGLSDPNACLIIARAPFTLFAIYTEFYAAP
jgi:hypothetical protein